MTINSGTRLGPYEILSPIGVGGMGEVYKARDTRLDRSVAVKILPAEFAQNAQFKLRFEREAKTISQLNHPHICTLHDVGHENGVDYLVMEFLEGESLADRLRKGSLSLEDVLRYGIQIAEALDKAHRQGVVHRDLKPGNVMLTKSGAKLLDFGLAKPGSFAVTPLVANAAAMVTEHKVLTQEGTIIGTFQYMAPEQIEGREADARSDIFALGSLLYEMATGKRAFEGKSKASLVASILDRQPPPISSVQPMTPTSLEHVVKKCLEKDPEARWQSAFDVAEELRWISTSQSEVRPRATPSRVIWLVGPVIVAALAASAVFLALRWRAPHRVVVSSIEAPENAAFSFDLASAVLSPDGSKIMFVATGADGKSLLYIRALDSSIAQPLSGTTGATFPFWSPDSRSIAFFANSKLNRIEAKGGPVESLAEASTTGRGGSWNGDGDIIFAPSTHDTIYRIADTGGEPKPVTTLDLNRFESSHRYPVFLPDGKHFVYLTQNASVFGNLLIGSLDGGASKLLLRADANALYVNPGYLLFMRDRILRAQRFDTSALKLIGDPLTIAENVHVNPITAFMNVSASSNGLLAFVLGSSAVTSRIVSLDRSAKEVDLLGEHSEYYDPRISPNGKWLAATISDARGYGDIYLYDIVRHVKTRFTFSPANEISPVWSPDGEWIAFTSYDHSPGDILKKRVSGAEAAQPLIIDKQRKIVTDWSRDGRFVIYHSLNVKTHWHLEAYDTTERKARVLIQTQFNAIQGRLSPNGQWLAYTSDESGSNEVYVQPFSASASGKWQVSSSGGSMPIWSHDGRQLFFYSSDGKLMITNVDESHGFAVDTAKPLFAVRMRAFTGVSRHQYDVSPDDHHFLINTPAQEQKGPVSITLIENWMAKLQR